MAKTQRWEWAIGLKLEELNETHLQAAYKLNWDSLCKFDSCRKNCKRILCLACFDKSWIENESANNSGYDNYETTDCEQKRADIKTFVGLKNLGATCYVNCLLQLWFHNPALRKAIYEWEKVESNVESQQTNNVVVVSTPKKTTLDVDNIKQEHREQLVFKSTPKRQRDEEKHQSPPIKKLVKSSTEITKVTDSKSTSSSQISPISRNQKLDPVEQLQLIFARLQFTNKKSIDPMEFIDSLNLNAAEQQDAQEFGNLFMMLLENQTANQKSSFVSKIIQSQFRGQYSYVTTCDHCKHSSMSDSHFYELDLNIQDSETLHDCLEKYFKPLRVDGKYECSHCQKYQIAHRKIVLKSLPPTLNLQLLRFIYDKQKNNRQKLNSYITFPEILDMNLYLEDSNAIDMRNNVGRYYSSTNGIRNSNIYILSAVLIHRGSSPHSGHYIAHIKDRITRNWYKFNDDSVEKIGPQLQVSTDGENITIVDDKTSDPNGNRGSRQESKNLKSKTAYMLVYQAQDNEALSYPSDHSEKWVLPEHLQTAVAEENSRSEEIFESLQIAKEVDQQIMDQRKDQIKTIYEKLVCRDPSDEFEFIDKNWLQRWLTDPSSSAKFPPIDNSNLLCMHEKLDFRKIDQVRCVRSEGVDMLYEVFGGGPRLKDAMCRDCVELEVKLIQLKERMKEDQKYITSQAKFKLDADYDFADAYIVGKRSYRDWQLLVMVQFEKSYPELMSRERVNNQQASSDEDDHKNDENNNSNSDSDDEAIEKFLFNSDILCEHNQLVNDTSAWRIVPKEVWTIFKHYFGNDPSRPLIEHNANTIMCPECKRQEVEQQEIGDIQKQKALEQKTRLPDLFHNRKRASWCSMLPGDEYYALDRQFLTKWQKFIRNPCNQDQPTAIKNRDKLICEHGKSLYNYTNSNPVLPESPFVLINGGELNNLKFYYPIDYEIKFTVDSQVANEKLKIHMATLKNSPSKRPVATTESGDNNSMEPNSLPSQQPETQNGLKPAQEEEEEIDLTEIDWSECVTSDPDYCSECHEMLKQDELKKLLNYESATIYITKVENPCTYGPQNNPNLNSNGGNSNCDNEVVQTSTIPKQSGLSDPNLPASSDPDILSIDEQHPFKKRKKIYIEDEANDFVPPGVTKTPVQAASSSNSILRRTTRRNRNKEQAYTIKPTQTLLQLKKEIFSRCQVLPVDQRLFLNDIMLDDNSKTMSELRIVPNCSLKLEVDRPISDNVDSIEDESTSRKSSAQPETGFKGSLLLSNSHY